MKIYTALTITALLSTPLAVFADAGPDVSEKALVENRELIEKQVASLNLELAKFTKTLKDEKVSREEKAAVVNKMAFMFGFPDDCEELVQTLSNILKDKETPAGTQKWILQMFTTMGAKASKAESAIEHILVTGSQYPDLAMAAMASAAPKNVLFQKIMNDILESLANPDVPFKQKVSAALMLVSAGRLDENVLNTLLNDARRDVNPIELLHVARHAEKLSDADRKRYLEFVKEPLKKSYDTSVKNYFRETMQGNTSKAMIHFAETLDVTRMEASFSFMHLSRLKKSEIKLLAPVLIDLMKKGDVYGSIAYLLSDQAGVGRPNND